MAKQTKEKKGTTYNDVLHVRQLLSMLKNKGLTVQSLTNVVRFKAEVEAAGDQYYVILEELMKKHDVKAENGAYKVDDHPKAGEIKTEVTALQTTACKFSAETNFMSWKELHAATEDLPVDILTVLAKWLVKDE